MRCRHATLQQDSSGDTDAPYDPNEPSPIVRGVEMRYGDVSSTGGLRDDSRNRRIDGYETVLIKEASGIFNWMIEGLKRYRARGNKIKLPESVEAETIRQRSEMDELGPFLGEQFVKVPEGRVDRIVIYDRYHQWCDESGIEAMSKRAFAEALKKRDITDGGKVGNRRMWRGIRLKRPDEIKEDELAGSVQTQF